jgi:glucose 1-dehydrogenase
MARLDGKAALVTGGARGIGLSVARRFVQDGAKVMIADIDPAGASAARAIGCRFVRADVGAAADAAAAVQETCAAFGRLDVLINNAGIIHAADFLALEEADFDRVLRVNLKGAFLVGQQAARRMVSQIEAGEKPGAIGRNHLRGRRAARPQLHGHGAGQGAGLGASAPRPR